MLVGPAPLPVVPCPWLMRARAGWRVAFPKTLGSSEPSPGARPFYPSPPRSPLLCQGCPPRSRIPRSILGKSIAWLRLNFGPDPELPGWVLVAVG